MAGKRPALDEVEEDMAALTSRHNNQTGGGRSTTSCWHRNVGTARERLQGIREGGHGGVAAGHGASRGMRDKFRVNRDQSRFFSSTYSLAKSEG